MRKPTPHGDSMWITEKEVAQATPGFGVSGVKPALLSLGCQPDRGFVVAFSRWNLFV